MTSRYIALATLTSVYTLNLVDRGLMALLLQPIKEDLCLSDTQLGFLTGIAFGLFYAILGLPIARLADRGDRVSITAAAIGLWGVTVMSCLFVNNYVQLIFARFAAAIGESGCKPPTYSLVGDLFPRPAERTRAMAVYLAGSPLSSLLAFLVGGCLNELYGWRMTFFLMGAPGLLLSLVVKFAIKDPRLDRSQSPGQKHRVIPLRTVLRRLWSCRSLRHLCIAIVLLYATGLGLAPWYGVFMIRMHGMQTGELGIWLGLIFSLGGIGGALLGGYVSGRWFANDERIQMRMSSLTVASLTPFFVAFLTVPEKHQALIALVPMVVAFSVFLGPTYALMQRLVADEMRATMMAVIMLLANLIGFGLGPQAVGLLSDALTSVMGKDALRGAMLAMSFVALWTSYHFWSVGRTIKEDLILTAQQPS